MGLEVVVSCIFWSISMMCRNCKKKWWKSAITLSLGNVMTSGAQVRCKGIEATLYYCIKFLSSIVNSLWFLAEKWVKILIVPSFWLKFDDVTVRLSLIVLSRSFLRNLPWYCFTSCQNLLRLNVIFMIRKGSQLLLNGGGCCHPPAPSLCLILEPRR